MKYTAEEVEKIASIIIQIDDYLNEQRKNLRKTFRLSIPNDDGYKIELVIPSYSERYDTENLLVIGCASYYFGLKGQDDWLHSLQKRPENAAYIINWWKEIKIRLKYEIAKQQEEIKKINNFEL